jgi:hypothetical protein
MRPKFAHSLGLEHSTNETTTKSGSERGLDHSRLQPSAMEVYARLKTEPRLYVFQHNSTVFRVRSGAMK